MLLLELRGGLEAKFITFIIMTKMAKTTIKKLKDDRYFKLAKRYKTYYSLQSKTKTIAIITSLNSKRTFRYPTSREVFTD